MAQLSAGQARLDPDQAHHLRDVLRLEAGEAIEVFDDAGTIGSGVIDHKDVRENRSQLVLDRGYRTEDVATGHSI